MPFITAVSSNVAYVAVCCDERQWCRAISTSAALVLPVSVGRFAGANAPLALTNAPTTFSATAACRQLLYGTVESLDRVKARLEKRAKEWLG